jgi:hypothetical protein
MMNRPLCQMALDNGGKVTDCDPTLSDFECDSFKRKKSASCISLGAKPRSGGTNKGRAPFLFNKANLLNSCRNKGHFGTVWGFMTSSGCTSINREESAFQGHRPRYPATWGMQISGRDNHFEQKSQVAKFGRSLQL